METPTMIKELSPAAKSDGNTLPLTGELSAKLLSDTEPPATKPPSDAIPAIPNELLQQAPATPPPTDIVEMFDDDNEVVLSMSDRQKEAFIKMRTALKSSRESTQTPPETKKIQEELAAANARLKELDLTGSSEFQATYQNPINNSAEQISKMVKSMGLDEALVPPLLKGDFQARRDALNGQDSAVLAMLLPALATYDAQVEAKTAAIANVDTTAESLANTRTTKLHSEIDALPAQLEKNYLLATEVAGNDDWNSLVHQIVDEAKQLSQKENLAVLSYKAAMADHLQAWLIQERGAGGNAQRKLDAIQAATPGMGGGVVPGGNTLQGTVQPMSGKALAAKLLAT